MKVFLVKALVLLTLIVLVITLGMLLPTVKNTKNSLLYAQITKNKLLQATPSPRLLLIGGSNLSFGLDSKTISDSLHINPINTGLHASLGLKYMLENAVRFVQRNDIIIVCPEYQQYYGYVADGNVELLYMLFDVVPKTKKLLDTRQWLNLLQYMPQYSASKLNPLSYLSFIDTSEIGIYTKRGFNIYGDEYLHWKMKRQEVPTLTIDGSLNNNIIDYLITFKKAVELKKAKIFIAYPGYQHTSFMLSVDKIKEAEKTLQANGLTILGTPERYIIADSLVFNTPYHLTRQGVTIRTSLLITDLRNALRKK